MATSIIDNALNDNNNNTSTNLSSNVYVLLNRDYLPDIENQYINDISNNFEVTYSNSSERENNNCVICYYDFSNTQIYTCVRCKECKLCLKCTLKVFNKKKCPVCQKPDPWCKKPNGKVVKLTKIKTPNQERYENTLQNRNNYSKCYIVAIIIFFIIISYLWLKQKGYKF